MSAHLYNNSPSLCAARTYDQPPAVITSPSTAIIEGRSNAPNATTEDLTQALTAAWASRTSVVKVAKAIRQKAPEKDQQFTTSEGTGRRMVMHAWDFHQVATLFSPPAGLDFVVKPDTVPWMFASAHTALNVRINKPFVGPPYAVIGVAASFADALGPEYLRMLPPDQTSILIEAQVAVKRWSYAASNQGVYFLNAHELEAMSREVAAMTAAQPFSSGVAAAVHILSEELPTATILGAQSARSMAESNVVPASVKNALLASKKADDAQAAVALAVRAAFQPHSSSAFDPITQLALAGALNTDGSVNLELAKSRGAAMSAMVSNAVTAGGLDQNMVDLMASYDASLPAVATTLVSQAMSGQVTLGSAQPAVPVRLHLRRVNA